MLGWRRTRGPIAMGVLLGVVVGGGCTHPVRQLYARAHYCDVGKTRITEERPDIWRAEGCGPTDLYHCTPRTMQGETHCAYVATLNERRPAPARQSVSKVADKPSVEAPIASVLYPTRHGFRVAAGALPDRAGKVHFQFRFDKGLGRRPKAPCDVRLLVGLKRVAVGEVQRKDRGKGLVDVEVEVSFATAVAIASSSSTAWRVCGTEWDMDQRARGSLGELLVRLRKASAWDEEPGERHLTPPDRGWPVWAKAAEHVPPPSSASEHDPVALFEAVRGSVYSVKAELADGTAYGSAVAFTETRLLTNCHVVAASQSIAVLAGGELEAKLIAAHPDSDRCVIEVPGATLKPVAGVRGYGDLKVGERAFTVGSPEGFEATLGEGLVSGLREEEGMRFVQTSAPISKGSSGGGLFDARGNLIGITTLMWVGETGTAQSLNFAIAAEDFFRE